MARQAPATDGRPYHYRIGEQVAQFDMHNTAMEWSKKIGYVVSIVDTNGKVIERVDGREDDAPQVREPATSTLPRAPASPGLDRLKPGTKQEKAVALLMRERGATSKELSAAMGWSMGQWHVNRCAQVTGLTLEVLGDKHWRLVKND